MLPRSRAVIHRGPAQGVDPSAQGRHVGSQLMRQFCEELDRRALPGYLETDRPQDVRFYERFGFEVVAEDRGSRRAELLHDSQSR